MSGDLAEKKRRPRIIVRMIPALSGLILAGLLLMAFLLMTGLHAPAFLRSGIENRLNASLGDERISIGDIRLQVYGLDDYPRITLEDISVSGPQGQSRARIPEIRAEFSATDLLRGRLNPVSITLSRAELNLKRTQNGEIDVSVGNSGSDALLERGGSIEAVLGAFDDFLAVPVLSRLREVRTDDSHINLVDTLSGRNWQFTDAALVLENNDGQRTGSLSFKLDSGSSGMARASVSWQRKISDEKFSFTTRFNGFQTEDIADQVVAFDWLRALDAPVSGSMSLDVFDDGTFGQMSAVLDIGAGSIRQSEQARPVRFNGAKTYLTYDQATEKMSFDQITLDTDAAQIVAEGHAYLSDRIDRTVGAIIAQLRFTTVLVDPKGVFAKPLTFKLGALDMRVKLDPLAIDIGQLVLMDEDSRFHISGSLAAGDAGWKTALDLRVGALSRNRALEIWPLPFKEKTRSWLQTNAISGRLENIVGALRSEPGQKPKVTFGFDVEDLNLRFMRTMPPIEDGRGYGLMTDNHMNLVLEQGTVDAPEGGMINVAGTSLFVPDTRIKGPPATVSLRTQSSLQAVLSTLDLAPFEFLSKAGLGTDIADGVLRSEGKIALRLVEKVDFRDVGLEASGKITKAVSKKLVPGKIATADALDVFVNNDSLTISGDARLGKLPINGTWTQKLGPANKGSSTFEGRVEISRRFVNEFGIGLPEGSVKGRGSGHVRIDLARGQKPAFELVSDLNRVALAIEPLGWSKAANTKGRLFARGQFGTPPSVDEVSIRTRGLTVKGSVRLKPDGRLKLARFGQVDVDGWMKSPVDITTDSSGNAAFALNGGVVDFRKSRFGNTPESENGQGNRITTRIDRLILSSGVSLTDIEGEINSRKGVTGSFSGRVNGQARIVGTLAPLNGGTAVRFTSGDAGAVMRSAGVFSSAHGGRLDMVLVPSGKSGHYDGTLKIEKTRVRNASALADLLSAISVVGLLEQLGGAGIAFNTINAKFLLTPDGVIVRQSSAVGASLGLTMEGAYGFTSQTMEMQGVITPIYMLNGILEQTKIFGGLFGKQKGEGLFGFNYTLSGDVAEPEVGVNPLSILTPGLFRDLFRQPMPKVDE